MLSLVTYMYVYTHCSAYVYNLCLSLMISCIALFCLDPFTIRRYCLVLQRWCLVLFCSNVLIGVVVCLSFCSIFRCCLVHYSAVRSRRVVMRRRELGVPFARRRGQIVRFLGVAIMPQVRRYCIGYCFG